MTSSLHQGGVFMSSQITHAQLSNIHTLANILGTSALISVVGSIYSSPKLHNTPFKSDVPPEH